MLHVLPLPSEHSPTSTSSPWLGLRGHRPRLLRREKSIPRRKFIQKTETDGSNSQEGDDESAKLLSVRQRSISECYFAVKGAALVLPQNECINYRKSSASGGGDIQQHLQSMFYLLRQEDTLKMAVKLESNHMTRTRYLVVVSCTGKQNTEENCLLGVDCNEQVTIGLVLPVWADTVITLDGDGGFRVSSIQRNHIFKPVSVQAMWSAIQTLHKASAKARENNYFMGGLTHSWIDYYEKKIASDRSCLNEWHLMDNLETRRPPSPDCCRSRPEERELTEQDIRGKLKEIMMTVDLDEVTSKYIRSRLEEVLDMDLQEYKSFIDQEMITILGQMDKATEIFDHLYLGSEWNASNLEELQKNGVGHILNVTREIDNFFPGMFDYLNIRVYDDEGTELLRHWDTTYKFITNAKDQGSKVLVHCKMGVSRSASVVIAYAMKAHNWNMQKAHKFVKNRRTCIKPNTGFMRQLEIYQGILCASKHRHNQLWRSKSENNLKIQPEERQDVSSQPEEPQKPESAFLETPSHWLTPGHRPKSWSPDDNTANMLFPAPETPDEPNLSMETTSDALTSPTSVPSTKSKNHVLLTCRDAKTYSVSPNKALHLDMPTSQPADSAVKFQIGDDESPIYECRNPIFAEGNAPGEDGAEILTQIGPVPRVSSIKDRINELESHAQLSELRLGPTRERLDLPENTGLVLNLTSQFESVSKSNPASPVEEDCPELTMPEILGNEPVVSQTKPPVLRHQAVLVRPGTWEEKPPEASPTLPEGGAGLPDIADTSTPAISDLLIMRVQVEGRSPPVRLADPFSTHVDHVFEWEEQSQQKSGKVRDSVPARHDSWGSCDSAIGQQLLGLRESPSRQSSWGSVESRGIVLSRETSWGSGDAAKRPQMLPEGDPVLFIMDQEIGTSATGTVKRNNKANIIEDGNLKRTSSFNGTIPLHDTNASSGASTVPSGGSNEFSQGNLIQRSQSLRTSTASSKRGIPRTNASGSPPKAFTPNLRLHGPKPYSSPPEKHVHLVMDHKPWLHTSVSADRGTPLYASTPILYKSIRESVPAGPLHSASQPNITYSQPTSCVAPVPQPSKSRSGLRLDLGSAAYQSPEQASEEVPCPGIVRQQKEVIENIIAAHPGNALPPVVAPEQSPPAPPERKPCSAEELKRVQQKLQLLDFIPKMTTPPAAEADDGVVKRIKRVIEAKGVVVVAGGAAAATQVPTVAADGRSQNCDKVIILDVHGKELAAMTVVPQEDVVPAEARLMRACSVEEKSVKSLVGKFEVKEQPTRQRYFSETEVTSGVPGSAPPPPSPPTNCAATRTVPGTVAQLHHCGSLDLGKSKLSSESRNTGANNPPLNPCDKSVKVVGTDTGFKGFSSILGSVVMPRNRPPPAAKVPLDSNATGTTTAQVVAANAAQRKVRKAQGKTHPLSKLQTKHRHLNPFYNTV